MIVPVQIERLWRGGAVRFHNGICGDCGGAAMVARQRRAPRFQCVECFALRPPAAMAKRVREILKSHTTEKPSGEVASRRGDRKSASRTGAAGHSPQPPAPALPTAVAA